MEIIYIVKSFGPENGYMNLKAFTDLEDAEAYQDFIQKQIDDANAGESEFVEIEDMVVNRG
jgi:hypothetical protein